MWYITLEGVPMWEVWCMEGVSVDCGRRFCVGMKRMSVWGLGVSCVL